MSKVYLFCFLEEYSHAHTNNAELSYQFSANEFDIHFDGIFFNGKFLMIFPSTPFKITIKRILEKTQELEVKYFTRVCKRQK